MNIPRLRIRQQYGKIDIKTKNPELKIRQPRFELKIEQADVKLDIRRKNAKLEIDNYPHRRDLKMRNITDFRKKNIQIAREAVMECIARYARNGDRLMAIHKDHNALQQIIEEEASSEPREVTLRLLSGPEFSYKPGSLDIKFKEKKADISFRPSPPKYQFIRGRVEINMAQYNNIEIDVKGNNLDTMV